MFVFHFISLLKNMKLTLSANRSQHST